MPVCLDSHVTHHSAGGRHGSYNAFEDATTYRVTGGYTIKETGTTFREVMPAAFKAPTMNDLFFQGFGNPNLQPEKSSGMDVGIEQSPFNDRLRLCAGYLWNRFLNLIPFASGGPLCPPATFGLCLINAAGAKTQGWRFAFKLNVFKGFDLRGQYTYTLTRAFDTPANPLGGDKGLPRWPVDQATIGLPINHLSLTLNVDYRFMGA